jgi:hypothetical protein
MENPNAILLINQTFRQGLRTKSIYFEPTIPDAQATISFKIGYWLWGMDIWIGRIPMIRFMLLANLIMWIILFITN